MSNQPGVPEGAIPKPDLIAPKAPDAPKPVDPDSSQMAKEINADLGRPDVDPDKSLEGIANSSVEDELDATEKRSVQVTELASSLHNSWREARRIEGTDTYEPRIKQTKDAEWIEKHGTNQVDIANTFYVDLPSEWQAENNASATSALQAVDSVVASGGLVDDPAALDKMGDIIHQQWLERNGEWAPAEQKLPYAELTQDEQEKDRVVVREAIRIYKGNKTSNTS